MSASSIGAGVGFAVGGPVGALVGYSAGSSREALVLGRDARRAQENLEAQRRKQLSDEAASREAAKTRAESSGQRVGRGRNLLLTGFGFGSGNAQPGLGAGNIFGN